MDKKALWEDIESYLHRQVARKLELMTNKDLNDGELRETVGELKAIKTITNNLRTSFFNDQS